MSAVDDRELVTTRVLEAPPERVFRAYQNESVFTDVAPERIVIDHVSPPRFTLTITLAPERGKTRLTWRQRFPTAAGCERIRALAAPANEQNLDRLAARLVLMGRGSV